MQDAEGVADVLGEDEVDLAWEEDPTLTLLRGYSARWVLPLFSQHLEFANGPVSGDWFHQKVAEARERNPEWAGDVSPAEHCKNWVDNRWLLRTRGRGRDRAVRYRLSPYALRALRIVREVIHQETTVSEARLGSIGDAVRKLADMSNPSQAAQLERIDEQIAELQRRRADVAAGYIRAATSEEMTRQLREILQLTASLPEDFRQLGAMVEQRHREVSRRASTESPGKGALVEAYLREHDLLDKTVEGRSYRGFTQALGTHALERLREDIGEVLYHDFGRSMTAVQRIQLEGLVSSLLAEDHAVQETYRRWTASLRRFLSRSINGRHQRLLQLADEALEAGLAWTRAQPAPASLPDVLGVGALDLKDISQVQTWRDPGPRSVRIVVESNDDPLPESDKAALRIAAGTAPAAVAATINTLLEKHSIVTARQVYDATPGEFRRLATVLSLLDLGVAHGRITDESTEQVQLHTEHGQSLDVALPHVLFDHPVVLKGPHR